MSLTQYSEGEVRLLTACGVKAKYVFDLKPHHAYQLAIQNVFFSGETGPHVDALRRAAKAVLIDCTPYRLTAEFEKLIEYV